MEGDLCDIMDFIWDEFLWNIDGEPASAKVVSAVVDEVYAAVKVKTCTKGEVRDFVEELSGLYDYCKVCIVTSRPTYCSSNLCAQAARASGRDNGRECA